MCRWCTKRISQGLTLENIQYRSKQVTTLSRDANRVARYVIVIAQWPKNCKYHVQNSWAIPRISGKALPWLTREQIFTYATCRLLSIIHFVKVRYLHVCAKHAFNKVALHHLENYNCSKHVEMIQNVASLVTACRFC